MGSSGRRPALWRGGGATTNRHLETLGLAVAYAELHLIPPAIRSAYASGATPAQVQAAIEGGCFLADVPPAIRTLALEIARAWAWLSLRPAAPSPAALRLRAIRRRPPLPPGKRKLPPSPVTEEEALRDSSPARS